VGGSAIGMAADLLGTCIGPMSQTYIIYYPLSLLSLVILRPLFIL